MSKPIAKEQKCILVFVELITVINTDNDLELKSFSDLTSYNISNNIDDIRDLELTLLNIKTNEIHLVSFDLDMHQFILDKYSENPTHYQLNLRSIKPLISNIKHGHILTRETNH